MNGIGAEAVGTPSTRRTRPSRGEFQVARSYDSTTVCCRTLKGKIIPFAGRRTGDLRTMSRSQSHIALTDVDDILACLSRTGRARYQSWTEERRERFLELYRSHQAIGRSPLGAILRSWGASAREGHEG